jgi:hypothetical protein
MAKKRRKIFRTREEYEAWQAQGDELTGRLQVRLDKLAAELGRDPGPRIPLSTSTPEEHAAWRKAGDERYQELLQRIERNEAELEAKRKSA